MTEQLPTEAPAQGSAPRTSNNTKWIVLAVGGGCALLTCAILAIGVIVSVLIPRIQARVQAPTPVAGEVAITPGLGQAPNNAGQDNAMGDPNARVKIIEYADFQCPYCRLYWQQTEPQIIETYVKTGKVYYQYRSVGAFLGEESANAAEAAYCAGDQGKFWEYHDTLFKNGTGENVGDFTKEKLSGYAAALGLDKATFDTCLNGGKYGPRVQQDVNQAKSDGVQATPTFIVNGQKIEGAQPFAVFQKAIDEALQGH